MIVFDTYSGGVERILIKIGMGLLLGFLVELILVRFLFKNIYKIIKVLYGRIRVSQYFYKVRKKELEDEEKERME